MVTKHFKNVINRLFNIHNLKNPSNFVVFNEFSTELSTAADHFGL